MGGLLNSQREDPVKMLTKEQLAKRIQEIENIASAKTVALEETGDGVFKPKNLN